MRNINDMIDLTGQKFDRLAVIRRDKNTKRDQTTWLCLCDCGQTKIIRGDHLRNNTIKSCGCLRTEIVSKITHGHSRRNKISNTYYSWINMIRRCNDPTNNRYSRYGGRGIFVCDRWLKFSTFLADMGERLREQQIDRINNNDGYYKENCRWTTPKQNSRNRKNNHKITFNGKTQCISEWAEELDVNSRTISSRLNRGWSVEKTLATPVL